MCNDRVECNWCGQCYWVAVGTGAQRGKYYAFDVVLLGQIEARLVSIGEEVGFVSVMTVDWPYGVKNVFGS